MKPIRVLCVHGVGRHPPGGAWEAEWRRAIEEPLRAIDAEVQVEIGFAYLDDLFQGFKITALGVLEAIGKLAGSAAGSRLRQPRGIGDDIRWTAGMVVQWVENDKLRRLTRARVTQAIEGFAPDIVVAHSLGSLVCYDSFTTPQGAALIKGRRFVSAGSQIGNAFVVGNFAMGRITPLEGAEFWYHLYNAEDDVFTAPLRVAAPNFVQIDTFFDLPGFMDHAVEAYMRHPRAAATVWADAVAAAHRQPMARRQEAAQLTAPKAARGAARWATKPTQRALIVGINEYADPAQNLEGCVNDAFLVSALLQESGFAAEDIRLLLNERATSASLQERLQWLLEDARPGDTRVLYYSGHGAQMPAYGLGERVDSVQETLVLHDFDWTNGRAFTDTQFHELYSQLPYELNFVAMFDCCHSGGMTRAGGRRVRGIDPPDDVRHRMLRWDGEREMWVPREFDKPNPGFDRQFNAGRSKQALHVTHALGQAMTLRPMAPAQFKRAAAGRGHLGPYMPVLIYASRADQYSYEYQHGPIAHGAFTYCLAKTLRRARRTKKAPSFESLVAAVRTELAELGYEQEPSLVAPRALAHAPLPI